ncbi:MAG: hypothetical protein IPO91_25410 [Chloroflexi bacterium]|nr:hypothetical protein [Chloroflexota bacterium]
MREIGGIPAVSWDQFAVEFQQEYTNVIVDNIPSWPDGAYSAALVEGWYENVATNIDLASE